MLKYFSCLYYLCFTIPSRRTTDPLGYTDQHVDFDIFPYPHDVPIFAAYLQCPWAAVQTERFF